MASANGVIISLMLSTVVCFAIFQTAKSVEAQETVGRLYATYHYLHAKFVLFYQIPVSERSFLKWRPNNIKKARFDTCMLLSVTGIIFPCGQP